MAYRRRTIETAIRRAMRTFPAVMLSGPRQSGKTTLIRRAWGRTHRYVSLERPDVRARARADPAAFFAAHRPPVMLDEIQYAPELLHWIKQAIDEDRRAGRWLLTGSQSLALMAGVSQSLAGRVAVMTLLPFSPGEAAGRPEGDLGPADLLARLEPGGTGPRSRPEHVPELGEWLLRGAYPEPRANPRVDVSAWCAGYVQTYLERDVRTLGGVGNLSAFERFLRLAAARTGQLLNVSDLARDTGVSVPTARAWLSVLEASHEIFLLPPYHGNFGKRLVKSPKLYFTDTALAAFLTGLETIEAVRRGPMAGPLFETAVIGGWRKAFLHRGRMPPMYFWRSSDGIEVDLLIEYDGRRWPIECKLTATVMPGHADGIRKWMGLARAGGSPAAIFADIAEPVSVAPGVRAVPWWWT